MFSSDLQIDFAIFARWAGSTDRDFNGEFAMIVSVLVYIVVVEGKIIGNPFPTFGKGDMASTLQVMQY